MNINEDHLAGNAAKIPWKYSEPILFLLQLVNKKKYELVRGSRKRIETQMQIQDYNQTLTFCTEPLSRIASFKHSGNAGDVIYALPAIKTLAGAFGANLFFALDMPLVGEALRFRHSLGNVMLNRKMFEMFQPLLLAQDFIKTLEVYDGRPVDFDLDKVRQCVPLMRYPLNICNWYFYIFGVARNLAEPWLAVPPDAAFAGKIVVARSFRYRNLTLDYRFLRKYGNLVFVGIEEEWKDMKRILPGIEWAPVHDFLELARIIAASRLFIGNQSFPFSLAEALKVRRILEAYPGIQNVIPMGENASDVLFQKQFERVVGQMLESR